MISKEFERKIVKTLGLESLNAGIHPVKDKQGVEIKQLSVSYIWAVDVISQFGLVSLAILKSQNNHIVGLMKSPSGVDYDNTWREDKDLPFVTFKEWQHNLLEELRSFNLLTTSKTSSMGTASFECHVTFSTTHLSGNFKLYGPVRNDHKISRFWLSLLTAIRDISSLYDTDEMREFAETVSEIISFNLK